MPDAMLPLSIGLFGVAGLYGWRQRGDQQLSGLLLTLLAAAVCLSLAAVGHRWWQAGYGPFLTLHEILMSNVFSLGFMVTVFYIVAPPSRLGVTYALGVVVLIGLWAISENSEPAQLPATFNSGWLWMHVGFGKIFLGALLVAVGMALAGLSGIASNTSQQLDASIWRFAALAFVFDSSMLLTGALWANDAWGRYWNWDPVETWALVTWLALGLCLHARATWRLPLATGWLMITGVFVLAFLTLFGMPFLSLGPHKGIL